MREAWTLSVVLIVGAVRTRNENREQSCNRAIELSWNSAIAQIILLRSYVVEGSVIRLVLCIVE